MKKISIILYLIILFSNLVHCQDVIKILDKKISFLLPTDKIAEKGENKYINIKIQHTNNKENINIDRYKIMLLDENKTITKHIKEIELKHSQNHSGRPFCKNHITPKISITTESDYKILHIPYFLYCENTKNPDSKLKIYAHRYPFMKAKYKIYVTYKDKDITYYSDTIPLYVKRKCKWHY